MKLYWFKLYAAFRYDPKMQALSEIMQRRFVILLCMHCEAELLGRTDKEMCVALGIPLKQWLKTKELFIAKRLIDAQLNILNWEKYQAQILVNGVKSKRAPMSDAEKQAAYRERKKESALTEGVTSVTEGVTETVTSMVTPPKKSPKNLLENQRVTARYQNPLDIDIDRDLDADVDNRNLRSNSKSIAPHANAGDAPRSSARTFVAEFELPAAAGPKPQPESQSAASKATKTEAEPAGPATATAQPYPAGALPENLNHPAPPESAAKTKRLTAGPAAIAEIDYAARWEGLSQEQRYVVLKQVGMVEPKDLKRSAAAKWWQFPPNAQKRFIQAFESLRQPQPDTAPAEAPESQSKAAQTAPVPAGRAVDPQTAPNAPATQAAPPPANPDSDLNALGASLARTDDPDKGFIHADPKAAKNDAKQTASENPTQSRPDVVVAEAVDEDEKPRGKPAKSRKKELTQAQKNLNATIWQRYRAAYIERYGVQADPNNIRNKKINSQINDLRERLGNEAPDVAAFYVGINDGWLIRTGHSIGNLLQGYEGYRMQWITGRQVNSVTARQMENTQANVEAIKQVNQRLKSGYVNPLAALMAEAEAEEQAQLLEKKRA